MSDRRYRLVRRVEGGAPAAAPRRVRPAPRTLAHPEDAAAIGRRLGALRPESSPLWGRMTPHEMVCHLADALRMALGEREVRAVGGPIERTFVKWFALWAPVRWPRGIATMAEIDPRRAGSRPQAFEADRAALEALHRRVTAEAGTLEGRAHPLFGPLSRRSWLRWGWLHADHHLRQFGA